MIIEGTGSKNDNVAIDAAFASLNPERTRKERVVFIGDFVVNRIVIPSYTLLDLYNAKFASPNNINSALFYGSGVHDIDIFGGYLDGNGANQTTNGRGVDFINSANIRCCDMHIENVWGDAIYARGAGSSNIIISHNIINNVGGSGIRVGAGAGFDISHNIVTGNGVDGGISAIYGSHDGKINDNIVNRSISDGIWIGGSDIDVAHNNVRSQGSYGLVFRSGSIGIDISRNKIKSSDTAIKIISGKIEDTDITGNDICSGTTCIDGVTLVNTIRAVDNRVTMLSGGARGYGITNVREVVNNYIHHTIGRGITACGRVIGNNIFMSGLVGISECETIINNKVDSSFRSGIGQTSNCQIINNICTNNNRIGSTDSGIEISGTYNLVIGNRSYDTRTSGKTQYRGIKENSLADYNTYRDNYLVGNAAEAGIWFGTHNVYENNIGKQNKLTEEMYT